MPARVLVLAIAAKRNCGVRVLAIAVPISSTYIYGVPVGVLVLAIAATRGEHGVREPALRWGAQCQYLYFCTRKASICMALSS